MSDVSFITALLIEAPFFDQECRAELKKIGGTFRGKLCYVPLEQEKTARELMQQLVSREKIARLNEVNLYLLVRPQGVLSVNCLSLNVLVLTIFQQKIVCRQVTVEPTDNVEICTGHLMLEHPSKGVRRISYVAPEDSIGRILVRNVSRRVAVWMADAILRRDLFGYCSAVIDTEIVEISRKNQDLRSEQVGRTG